MDNRIMFGIVGTGGGYILSPTHAVGSDITPEKVMAIYDTAETCAYAE